MIRWCRNNPLGVVWGITVLVWGVAIATFQPQIPQVAPYPFPQVIPLSDWTFADSQPLTPDQTPDPQDIPGEMVSGQRYHYHQGDTHIQIEMRYLAQTNGDLKALIKHQTGSLGTVLQSVEGVGEFSLFTQSNASQLDACINPRGTSTVTSDQFKRNRTLYDWQSGRFLGWILGQAPLHDNRCLWTRITLSIPSDTTSVDQAQVLITTWGDWHQWWQHHFPPLPPEPITFSTTLLHRI